MADEPTPLHVAPEPKPGETESERCDRVSRYLVQAWLGTLNNVQRSALSHNDCTTLRLMIETVLLKGEGLFAVEQWPLDPCLLPEDL